MRISVAPILFKDSPDGIVPSDPSLYAAVMQYCEENLADRPNLRQLARVWAAIEQGENGEIIKIHGVTGYMMRPDIPLFRVTGEHSDRATKMLYDRLNSHFSDAGWLGHDVFLFINEKETDEQRCGNWSKSLELAGAVAAQRFSVRIK